MDKQVTLSALKAAHVSSMLVTAVVNALGRNWTNARETLRDVANHGADAGFRCLQGTTFDDNKGKWVACKPDNAMMTAISRAIYGARLTWDDNDVAVANALSWFALESVARTVDLLS